MAGTITVVNLRELRRNPPVSPQGTSIYVGRGRAPAGMENARLGNGVRVTADTPREGAVAAFERHFRTMVHSYPESHEAQAVARLTARHRAGEHLVLVCWCAPLPCHANVIAQVIREQGEKA